MSWRADNAQLGGRHAGSPTPRAAPNARQTRGSDDTLGAGGGPARKKRVRGGVTEAQAMSGQVSPSTGRRYPLTMICQIYRLARSSIYAARGPRGPQRPAAAKRGPKTQ